MCERVSSCLCVCVCVRTCVCFRAFSFRSCMIVYVCAFVCVGVRANVSMCVCGKGGKEKQVWVVMPSFWGSVVFSECLPRVHNDY